MSTIESWRQERTPAELHAIDALRAIVLESNPRVEESIKWNAPNFALDGQDRITLGIDRKGGVRVVLHHGAKKRPQDFSFADIDGLAQWPSADRGIITFADEGEIRAKHSALVALFTRWLEANR